MPTAGEKAKAKAKAMLLKRKQSKDLAAQRALEEKRAAMKQRAAESRVRAADARPPLSLPQSKQMCVIIL